MYISRKIITRFMYDTDEQRNFGQEYMKKLSDQKVRYEVQVIEKVMTITEYYMIEVKDDE